MGMESLRSLLNPGAPNQTATSSAARNSPIPLFSATQPREPPPGKWSTAAEPDSNIPNPPFLDSNEPVASLEPFLGLGTPPNTYNYNGGGDLHSRYHSNNDFYDFEKDCSTSGDESGVEDEG